MFHKEFYPTPFDVCLLMDLDVKNKIVLEPQGGKGDLVKFCLNNGAKKVFTYEINEDLRQILKPISQVLGADFLESKKEDICHVDCIVMNPPFSTAIKHILHAWEIAPEGCEIVSLCNYESIDEYENRQNGFSSIIENYGDKSNLGSCFDSAERKTNCNIGLIRLFKPVVSSDFNFDNYFTTDLDSELGGGNAGVLEYNEIRAVVNSYTAAVKEFAKLNTVRDSLNSLTDKFNFGKISVSASYSNTRFDKISDFSVSLQFSAWKYVFSVMNVEKYMTEKVKEKLNRFIKRQTNYPFTMSNIYKVIDMIFQTRGENFNESIVEVVENFTKHTSENRFNVEGWKTNSSYMLNKKIIIDNIVSFEYRWDKLGPSYNNYGSKRLDDLVKVLCHLTGRDFQEVKTIYDFCESQNGLERAVWYDWGFFKFKVFKKGTMHLLFKNDFDWFQINQAYGKIKGFVMPENCNPTKEEKPKKEPAKPKNKETIKNPSLSIEEAKQLLMEFRKSA